MIDARCRCTALSLQEITITVLKKCRISVETLLLFRHRVVQCNMTWSPAELYLIRTVEAAAAASAAVASRSAPSSLTDESPMPQRGFKLRPCSIARYLGQNSRGCCCCSCCYCIRSFLWLQDPAMTKVQRLRGTSTGFRTCNTAEVGEHVQPCPYCRNS